MTGKEAFKIWAPAGLPWVDWVRPVPFAAINDSQLKNTTISFTIPDIFYITNAQDNVAMIIDTPGYESVQEGIALARMGFRPIPLYNGTKEQQGAMALVDIHMIEQALGWGASELLNIAIPPNAPPAFLLDSSRTHRYKMNVSMFDNSWDLYDQDMPPAETFLNNGINKIIVRGEAVQKDLSRIMYQFQKKGIAIFFTNGYDPPKAMPIQKPLRKRSKG